MQEWQLKKGAVYQHKRGNEMKNEIDLQRKERVEKAIDEIVTLIAIVGAQLLKGLIKKWLSKIEKG